MAGIDQVDSRIWQAAEVAHIRLHPVVGAAVGVDQVGSRIWQATEVVELRRPDQSRAGVRV